MAVTWNKLKRAEHGAKLFVAKLISGPYKQLILRGVLVSISSLLCDRQDSILHWQHQLMSVPSDNLITIVGIQYTYTCVPQTMSLW